MIKCRRRGDIHRLLLITARLTEDHHHSAVLHRSTPLDPRRVWVRAQFIMLKGFFAALIITAST